MPLTWRPMTPSDIAGVVKVAGVIHAALPERAAIYAERVRLFPQGCLVLVDDETPRKEKEGKEGGENEEDGEEEEEEVHGYAISHPIRRRQPPALDTLLGEIVPDADQFYIHDVCVLPAARGKGYAADVVERLLLLFAGAGAGAKAGEGEGFATTCLVSVYGSAPFWARFGFVPPSLDDEIGDALRAKVRGYGDEAVYLERCNT